MLLKNPLVRPEAFEVPDFEVLLAEQKQNLIDLVREKDPEQANVLQETLSSDSELLTKFMRSNVLSFQGAVREANEKYRQTLPDFATGLNLDAVVKRLNLVRRENESDKQLRQRYFLSLAAPARGTKLGYIFQARTLDDNPKVNLIESDNGFSIQYLLQDGSIAKKIKAVNATSPAPGEVDIIFQAFDETDNPDIQEALEKHFAREKLLTDKVTILPAQKLEYSLIVTLGFFDDPDSQTILETARRDIEKYLKTQEFIGATVEPTEVIHLGRQAGAQRVEVEPSEPVVASEYEVPINILFQLDSK